MNVTKFVKKHENDLTSLEDQLKIIVHNLAEMYPVSYCNFGKNKGDMILSLYVSFILNKLIDFEISIIVEFSIFNNIINVNSNFCFDDGVIIKNGPTCILMENGNELIFKNWFSDFCKFVEEITPIFHSVIKELNEKGTSLYAR